MEQQDNIVSEVTQFLESRDDLPGLQITAESVGLSDRALRRRLQHAGTNYQQIIDQVRSQRARVLLEDSSASIEYVALCLGFNDASNFRRAFKRWTGETPSQFRSHLS